jgi:hypothetical protein
MSSNSSPNTRFTHSQISEVHVNGKPTRLRAYISGFTACFSALTKIAYFVKIRTYSRNSNPSYCSGPYVDKLNTGFLTWSSTIKSYTLPSDTDPRLSWEAESQAGLEILRQAVLDPDYLPALLTLWGQETSKTGKLELRNHNATFAKSMGKRFPFFSRNV